MLLRKVAFLLDHLEWAQLPPHHPWPCSHIASAQPREANGAKALQPQAKPESPPGQPSTALSLSRLRSSSTCGIKVEPQPRGGTQTLAQGSAWHT